jgi:hypothetical protein
MEEVRRKEKREQGNVKESSFMLNGRLWAAFLRTEKGKTDLPKTRFSSRSRPNDAAVDPYCCCD